MVLVALGVGGYLYLQLDDEIRRFAQSTLADNYPHLNVTVGSARFDPGNGVSLFDIRFTQQADGNPLLDVGELRLIGEFDLQSLATGEQSLERIEVRRPRLHASRDQAGRWDCAALWPPPKGEGPPPPISIRNATLVITDAAPLAYGASSVQPLTIRNVNLNIAEASAAGEPSTGFTIRGSIEDSFAKSIAFSGSVAPATGALHLTVETDRLHITNDLLASLPGFETAALADLRLDLRVGGRASVTVPSAGELPQWNGEVEISDGKVDHPMLPRPVSALAVKAYASQDQLQVNQLTAHIGGAELTASGDRHGWNATAPTTVTWRLNGLTLDEKLYYSLPKSFQSLWNRFRPTGTVDSTGSLTYENGQLKPDATITCRSVAFEDHEQFPYRLTDAAGALRFHDHGDPEMRGQLDVNLIAYGEGRPIKITGEFRGLPCKDASPSHVMPCPLGWIEISADDLRVTENLLSALPSNAQRVAQALQPAGEFAAKWRMERLNADQSMPQTTTVLTAKDCSLRYERFPYPLRHIVGQLHGQNGRWWFENATARDSDGRVMTGSGVLDPPATAGAAPLFRMRIAGAALPLDDALRDALPASAKQAWTEVQPRGRIDFTADVRCQGPIEPDIRIVMRPHKRDLSIEPKAFPYRLEGIDGQFVLADRRLTFQSARAHHGQTQFGGDGLWAPTDNGGWQLILSKLAVDKLDADHDFRLAAPIGLRRVLSRVDPQGTFAVHNGRLTITKPDGGNTPLTAAWDMEFDFHQADLAGGMRIEDAVGSVRITGSSQPGKTTAIGELRVDSLFWNDLQLTNVRGPLWCDETQCLLGAAAATKQQQPGQQQTQPRRVTGELYGGVASLNAQIIFDKQPRYGAAVAFNNVDLERFTAEYGRARTPLAGRVDGSLELQGLGTTVYGLGGTGEVHVREADFGELSVPVSLLKVLRSRAPDKTAFNRCDARFRLQGEHISFEQLDLLGDAFNLYGRGEARFDRKIDLTFRTLVGTSEVSMPILRSFVGQASEQLLTIRVDGTVDDPQSHTTTLPLVGNVLRQFQQEQAGAGAAPTTTPARRY